MRSLSHEDILSNKPVQQMIVARAENQTYIRPDCTNNFRYEKFICSQIVVYRNGQLIVGTPESTTFDHHLYFNRLEALVFLDKCEHIMNLADYPNHFILAFDLNSAQEDSHIFIPSEHRNCSIFRFKLHLTEHW